jgi:RHS repeat-associated protein
MSGEKKGTRFCQLARFVVMGFVLAHACVAAGANWTHTWGGPSNDYANAVAVDSSGNVYVAGSTASFGAGGSDVLILKYSPLGTLLWAKTWGGSGDEGANAIAVGPDGFLYVTGSSTSFASNCCLGPYYTLFVLKLDTDGNLQWGTNWAGADSSYGNALAFDATGNIYVVGNTYNAYYGMHTGLLIKFIPSDGSVLWASSWSWTSAPYGEGFSGSAVTVDLNGNVIIAGASYYYNIDTGVLHSNMTLLKYDANGNYLWNVGWESDTYPGSSRSLVTDAQGNIYVAGGVTYFSCVNYTCTQTGSDAMVLKFDSGGALQWENSWGGSGFNSATSAAIDTTGHLLVSGLEDQNGRSPTPFVLTYDSNGNLLSSIGWQAQEPLAPGYAASMAVDNAGNVCVASAGLNNAGAWAPISASGATLSFSPSSFFSYTLATPSAQVSSLSNPTVLQTGGVVDAGGGGTDAFVAKISLVIPVVGAVGGTYSQQAMVAEPVATGNGNYLYQHTDLVIPGRGIPLVFQRSYNTLDNYSGPLGTNWTHSYNIFLAGTPTGASIKWGDGHTETYTLSGGIYVPQPGVFSALIQNPDGTFVLTQKSQTRYLFSAAGSLASIVDKNGNTIQFTYSGAGNLTQITDTVGRNLTLSYDGSNRITEVTDPIGRTVSFSYSASDDLSQVTDTAGGVTQLTYDASHHVASITLPNSQTLLQNTYDSAGRVITQTNGRAFTTTFAYNTPSSGQTTITDARGNQTVHTYDSSLRIVTITDAQGGVVGYTYDANNDRTSVANQNGNTTTFAYDGDGNLTGITDPLGNSSAFSYDAKNDLLTATNPKGKATTFSYDANGNLRTIQDALGNTATFAYDGSGQLSSKTDARGHATTYGYDSFGNLNKITDPLVDVTTLGHDGIGRLITLTDPNYHTATAAYDSLSRLTTVTDPLGHQTKFAYDAVGNLLKITDANGHVTSYAYDAVNNLVTVTDALGHVTQYAYDANNNRTNFTNAKGNATSYAYDDLNRLGTVSDPLSFVTTYGYDPVGNVLAVKDANGKTNQFAYDALNRLIGILYADGKNVTYAYDADGNRTSMLDSHGTTVYSYDALDRLTNVTFPGGKTVAYGHDAVGNRNSLTYPDGKLVNYTYDAANRLAGVSDWLGKMTSYSYDAAGNLLAIAYPNKASTAFAYDGANRLTSLANTMPGLPALVIGYTSDAVGNRMKETVNGVATAFGYDPLNELISAGLGPLKAAWTYDAVGNRLTLSSPVGTIAYTYDAGDRLLTAGLAKYTYDNNGNQIAKTSGKLTWTYAYDAANRLVQALGYGMNSTFGYDGDGNRISQTNGSSTYSYLNDVATALPVVLNEQGPDGNITYAYGLGLIEESSSAFNYFYHYDGLGSVIGLTNASGKPQAAYAYDPWGSALLTVTDAVGTKNKFRFTGEALDPGTGLYYLRARYYDPGVGRFLGKDGFGWLVRDPRTANKYSYVLSNPVQYRDPSGRFPTSVVQFFVDLWDSASAASNAYEANQRLSQQCGYTGGSLDNCTQDVQLESQRQQQIAIRAAGQAAQSGIGVIYDPSLGGTGAGNSSVSDLFGIPGDVSWLVGKVKQLFSIPTAQAAQPSQTGAAGNPPAEPNQPGASANPFLGLETQTNAPSVPSGGGAQQRK